MVKYKLLTLTEQLHMIRSSEPEEIHQSLQLTVIKWTNSLKYSLNLWMNDKMPLVSCICNTSTINNYYLLFYITYFDACTTKMHNYKIKATKFWPTNLWYDQHHVLTKNDAITTLSKNIIHSNMLQTDLIICHKHSNALWCLI